MSIYLTNAQYVDFKSFEIKTHTIKVDKTPQTKIAFLEPNIILNLTSEDITIDCKDKFVMKSFACGHHHAYSALSRGMGGPLKTPSNFYDILKYLWWALDKSLDRDAVEASALTTAMACAKNGVTFIIDHHASPNYVKASLDVLAKAFEKVGVAHLLCYEISDRDGEKIAMEGLEETDHFLRNNQGLVGLHASFTVNNNTLKKAVEIAEKHNTGIHIHTAEDKYDQEYCLENYNKRVVERLHNYGALALPQTILVHCLHLNAHERELIANSPVFVAQNIESNLNNNVGIFNGNHLNDNIMLGTDGMHSDMLRALKATYINGQTFEALPMFDAYKRLLNIDKYIQTNAFKGYDENNLIVLDYKSPTPITADNFLGHLIFGIDSNHIEHVISSGNLIVKDRKLTQVNEQEIATFTQEVSLKLWERFRKQKV